MCTKVANTTLLLTATLALVLAACQDVEIDDVVGPILPPSTPTGPVHPSTEWRHYIGDSTDANYRTSLPERFEDGSTGIVREVGRQQLQLVRVSPEGEVLLNDTIDFTDGLPHLNVFGAGQQGIEEGIFVLNVDREPTGFNFYTGEVAWRSAGRRGLFVSDAGAVTVKQPEVGEIVVAELDLLTGDEYAIYRVPAAVATTSLDIAWAYLLSDASGDLYLVTYSTGGTPNDPYGRGIQSVEVRTVPGADVVWRHTARTSPAYYNFAPAQVGDTLLYALDDTLRAVSLRTGETIWTYGTSTDTHLDESRQARPTSFTNYPLTVESEMGIIYGGESGRYASIDLSSGRHRWSVNHGMERYSTVQVYTDAYAAITPRFNQIAIIDPITAEEQGRVDLFARFNSNRAHHRTFYDAEREDVTIYDGEWVYAVKLDSLIAGRARRQ